MAKTTIRAGIDQTLDVHREGFPQIAFNLIVLIDNFSDLDDLIFAQILDPDGAVDSGLAQDVTGCCPADPEHIGQADIRPASLSANRLRQYVP